MSWLQSLSSVTLKPKWIISATASMFSPSICREVIGWDDVMILVFECWILNQLFHSLKRVQECEIARCSPNQLEMTPDSPALAPEQSPIPHHTRQVAWLPLGNSRDPLRQSPSKTNWCFLTVMLEKTLESLLDCKEIKPVNLKGNQPWIFTGNTDAEAQT